MQCGSCGADAPDEAVYCQKCGNRLHFDGESPTQENSPVSPADKLRNSAGKPLDQSDANEIELWQGGYSGKDMVGSWVIAGIVSVLLIAGSIVFPAAMIFLLPLAGLVWIYFGCLMAYRKLAVHYELTSQRFIHKFGILRQVTDRIEVIDIDDVTVEQGIIQRVLGVGNIRVASSDRTHPELQLRGIDDVKRVADVIDDTRRKERRSRGLHIEAI